MATSEADMQNLPHIINEKSESLALSLNIKKPLTMVISKKVDMPTCNITVNSYRLERSSESLGYCFSCSSSSKGSTVHPPLSGELLNA